MVRFIQYHGDELPEVIEASPGEHYPVLVRVKDYLTYKEDLSFDRLCESLGNVFVEFLDLFKKGESVRIIDRMDALGLSIFS